MSQVSKQCNILLVWILFQSTRLGQNLFVCFNEDAYLFSEWGIFQHILAIQSRRRVRAGKAPAGVVRTDTRRHLAGGGHFRRSARAAWKGR